MAEGRKEQPFNKARPKADRSEGGTAVPEATHQGDGTAAAAEPAGEGDERTQNADGPREGGGGAGLGATRRRASAAAGAEPESEKAERTHSADGGPEGSCATQVPPARRVRPRLADHDVGQPPGRPPG